MRYALWIAQKSKARGTGEVTPTVLVYVLYFNMVRMFIRLKMFIPNFLTTTIT